MQLRVHVAGFYSDPNALADATSLVPLPRMIRSGVLLDLVGAIAIWLIVLVFFK